MPWKRKTEPFETIVGIDKLEVINWTHQGCLPCDDQKKTLEEIKSSINSEIFDVRTLNYEDYKGKFKKIGNKQAFPLINVFYRGKLIKFTDSMINPTETKGFIAGKRTKKDMLRIVEKTMQNILGES